MVVCSTHAQVNHPCLCYSSPPAHHPGIPARLDRHTNGPSVSAAHHKNKNKVSPSYLTCARKNVMETSTEVAGTTSASTGRGTGPIVAHPTASTAPHTDTRRRGRADATGPYMKTAVC